MVDTTTSFSAGRSVPRASSEASSVAVVALDRNALAVYERFASAGGGAPGQSAAWVARWVESVAPRGVVATLTREGKPALAVALEDIAAGPFRTLRFLGGTHANGNFPVGDPSAMAQVSSSDLAEIVRAIRRARPDIDLIRLERLALDIGGVRNPFLRYRHAPSPNIALAVDLTEGFEQVLRQMSGKRKCKKHRSQTRKFESAGGFRCFTATTPEDVDRLLDAFFAMKEVRFRRMGIRDVFGAAEVRMFFRSLFKQELNAAQPRFSLEALEVGGVLRAVTGSSICGARRICEFGSIAEDDLAHASPGDYLFFENIKAASDGGFAVYDFSVGDEPYKRLWCTIETAQFDVLLPLTIKGRAYASVLRATAATKARIKASPALWSLVRRLRRQSAGTEQTSAAAEAAD